jgi:hypothetical protein
MVSSPTNSAAASAKDVVLGVFWHMADALPAVGVPAVWKLDEPDQLSGRPRVARRVPLIAMRVLVAVGVIGFACDCWNAVTAPRVPAVSPPS